MGGTFPHPQGFQQRFGERGKAVDTLWRQQSKIKEGEIFRKKEDAGGGEDVILGNDPAEHCFVLKDLIPMKFFK